MSELRAATRSVLRNSLDQIRRHSGVQGPVFSGCHNIHVTRIHLTFTLDSGLRRNDGSPTPAVDFCPSLLLSRDQCTKTD